VLARSCCGGQGQEGVTGGAQDGEVRQEFSVCFACRILAGEIAKSDESLEVKFWPVEELDSLDMHPSIRLRISHYLSEKPEAFIA